MGDICNLRDIDRAMRCNSGRKRLEEIRAIFVGKTVDKVEFSNDIDCILLTLTFTTGDSVECTMPELMLFALKETYEAEIREEYYRDYPERRPKTQEGDTHNEGSDSTTS